MASALSGIVMFPSASIWPAMEPAGSGIWNSPTLSTAPDSLNVKEPGFSTCAAAGAARASSAPAVTTATADARRRRSRRGGRPPVRPAVVCPRSRLHAIMTGHPPHLRAADVQAPAAARASPEIAVPTLETARAAIPTGGVAWRPAPPRGRDRRAIAARRRRRSAALGPGCLGVEPGWGRAEAGCPGTCVQSPVPDGDDKVRVPDGQGAGEVDGVRAAQRVGAGEVAGVPFYGRGELYRTGGGPVGFPGLLGGVEVVIAEVVVAGGGGERGPHLGIGEAAGDGGVAAVP